MIKNIYDKENKQYRHEYYCDNCFVEITYGRVYRNEGLMKSSKIDLCYKCFKYLEIKNEITNDQGTLLCYMYP